MDTPATYPAQSSEPTSVVASLTTALKSQTPTAETMREAERMLKPAKADDPRPAARRAMALIESAQANFAPPEHADPAALKLADAWLLDAVLDRPMWAIKAGCKAITLSARFRPTPAEILEAIDAASQPLRHALAKAKFAPDAPGRGLPPRTPARTEAQKQRAAQIVAVARATARSDPEATKPTPAAAANHSFDGCPHRCTGAGCPTERQCSAASRCLGQENDA